METQQAGIGLHESPHVFHVQAGLPDIERAIGRGMQFGNESCQIDLPCHRSGNNLRDRGNSDGCSGARARFGFRGGGNDVRQFTGQFRQLDVHAVQFTA